MSPGNTLMTVLIIGTLIFGSNATAFTRADSHLTPGRQPGKVHERAKKIEKSTELMQRVEENVLYTHKNQYELTGVKVIDRAEGSRSPQTPQKRVQKQRVVEMTFIDDVLREVIIHK
jgi:hypothetical protein